MPQWLMNVPIADHIYMIILLITTILLIVRYRYLSANLRWLIGLAVGHLLVEIIADYIHFARHENNMYMYRFLAIAEYVLISFFFYQTFESTLSRKWVLVSIPIYIILVALFTWKWEPITEDSPRSFIAEGVLVLFWCFSFFRETLTREPDYRPESDPTFWVVVGIVIYFVGNFLILGGIDYFDKTVPELATKIYFAGYGFNYLLYLIISLVCIVRFPNVAHERFHN